MPDWPQNRVAPFKDPDFPEGLRHAWEYSATRIQRLRNAIADLQMPPSVMCVGVSGSLARMEAHAKSDVDLLIVIDDRNGSDCQDTGEIYSLVWDTLDAAIHDTDLVIRSQAACFRVVLVGAN